MKTVNKYDFNPQALADRVDELEEKLEEAERQYSIGLDYLNDNTFYNHGSDPIFISRSIKPGMFGAPGTMESKIIIMPGDGINLDCLDLKRQKPNQAHTAGAKDE
jgi:hypothetical protein